MKTTLFESWEQRLGPISISRWPVHRSVKRGSGLKEAVKRKPER